MRGKRSKQYRKLMQQYSILFQFREPYQVLVDAQMIQDSERFKMDLTAGLARTLQGQVKPMITQCSIRHLYSLPFSTPQTQKTAVIEIAKTFERRRCNHHTLEEPLSTLECYKAVIDPKSSSTNKHRYVVASQDDDVRRWCRGVRGVPTVYVKRSVMVMEPMAEASASVKEGLERGKLREGLKNQGTKRKRDIMEGKDTPANGEAPTSEGGEKKKKKTKGLKGPNPLSVKKSKKQLTGVDKSASITQDPIELSGVDTDAREDKNEIQNSLTRIKRKRKHKSSKSIGSTNDGGQDHESAA